ncbi:hypothetical protein Bca4012_044493 [Brassica carinata]
MEFLPAYEGLTKLISVEDDIRNWCFKPFKAILTCVKYASTTILSQVIDSLEVTLTIISLVN